MATRRRRNPTMPGIVDVYDIRNDWITSLPERPNNPLEGIVTSAEIESVPGASATDLIRRGAIEFRGRFPETEIPTLRARFSPVA